MNDITPATDAQIVAAVRKFPVFALNTAEFGFELACEIAEGSRHAFTASEVADLDHPDAVIILGTEFARQAIAAGHRFQGRVILVANRNDPLTWNVAGLISPVAVINFQGNAEVDTAAAIANRIRPHI
jgi:hypothetical protein